MNAIGDSVVRLAPALTLSEAEADEAVSRLAAAIAGAPASTDPTVQALTADLLARIDAAATPYFK